LLRRVHELCRMRKEKVMKRMTLLLLISIAAAGCSLAGSDKADNPRITPTSVTGVTSTKGQNVYEKIPVPAATTTAR
jgi:hypothetical protein